MTTSAADLKLPDGLFHEPDDKPVMFGKYEVNANTCRACNWLHNESLPDPEPQVPAKAKSSSPAVPSGFGGLPLGTNPMKVMPMYMGLRRQDGEPDPQACIKYNEEDDDDPDKRIIWYTYRRRSYAGCLHYTVDRFGPDGAKFGTEQFFILFPTIEERDAAAVKLKEAVAKKRTRLTAEGRIQEIEKELAALRTKFANDYQGT